MRLSYETTLKELQEQFPSVFPYFIYTKDGHHAGYFHDAQLTLHDLQLENSTWNEQDLLYGLSFLEDQVQNPSFEHSIYTEGEIQEDPTKKDVKLFFFPAAKECATTKFVILIPGGAYYAVCSFVEGYSCARAFAECGISTFVLNYRVGDQPLFPKPIEDLARAYRYISEHASIFHIDPQQYAVGGFSAGGHLAASYGLPQVGYSAYGYPKPQALFLGYPLLNMEDFVKRNPNPTKLLTFYFGPDSTLDMCKPYNIEEALDHTYPSTYLIQSIEDQAVSLASSKALISRLEELHIPNQMELLEHIGHGFGLGLSTSAEGWISRFVAFWNKI